MGNRPLRALTVRPPWADLIAYGVKTVENRTWTPSSDDRWLLLLHSGANPDPAGAAELPDWFEPLSGSLIAVFHVVQTHVCDGSCSPWAHPDRWHWVIDTVIPLVRPVPCRGQLGLWAPPPAVRAQLEIAA